VRRRSLVAAVLGIALFGAGCGGTAQDPEVLAQGREVFARSCASCHGGPTGGEISDIPPVLNDNGHAWHHPDCLLEEIVREGLPTRADPDYPVMRGFEDELDDAEIEATLALIKSWWTPEQREQQAELTTTTCSDD
jgi:mono/diheme cytochrome c family protein